MSLFKTRDWWSTQCGDGEDFDEACVAIGNADDAADGASKIVVGSHAGILRVLAEHGANLEAGRNDGATVASLALRRDDGAVLVRTPVNNFE